MYLSQIFFSYHKRVADTVVQMAHRQKVAASARVDQLQQQLRVRLFRATVLHPVELLHRRTVLVQKAFPQELVDQRGLAHLQHECIIRQVLPGTVRVEWLTK